MDNIKNHACITLEGPSYHDKIRFFLELNNSEESSTLVKRIIEELPCAPNAYDFLTKELKGTRVWSLVKSSQKLEQQSYLSDENRDDDDDNEIENSDFGLHIHISSTRKSKFTAADEDAVFDSIKKMNPAYNADENAYDTETAEELLEEEVQKKIDDPDVQSYIQGAEYEYWAMQNVDCILTQITPHTPITLRKSLVAIYDRFNHDNTPYSLSYDYEGITLLPNEKRIHGLESIDSLASEIDDVRQKLESLSLDEPEFFHIMETALEGLKRKLQKDSTSTL